MMDLPLTLDWVADRAERWMASHEIVSRRADRSLVRTTYGELIPRARRLARALVAAGIKRGDRVATLMWNHAEHLEAYFGIPLSGGVLHTLNLRLHSDEIAFIATDAKDRIAIVDDVLLPLFDKVVASGAKFERVIVVGNAGAHEAYEELLASAPELVLPKLAETDQLGVCYTGGTTGRPKGVVYTHRSAMLHTLVVPHPDALDVSVSDVVLPVVPMFHANAWGLPYVCAMVGCKIVFPGPHLDPPSLLDLMEREHVTCAAGVPTIWLGIRDVLEANPTKYKLEPNIRMIIGGSAAPEQLIRDFDKFGLRLVQAWGMTETSPVGTVSRLTPALERADSDTQYRQRAKQGRPTPLVDLRVRNENGDVPADNARCSCADRGSRRATRAVTRRSAGPTMATSAPATSRASTNTGSSSSPIGSRTSSSPAASGSRPWRSRTRSWGTPRSKKRRLSACRIRSGASGHSRRSC